MKKTLTIALLATVSAMFVAGFMSTQIPQAHAAASSSSVGVDFGDIEGSASASSAGDASGSAAGLEAQCNSILVAIGACSDSD